MSRRKTKYWSNMPYKDFVDNTKLPTFYAYKYYNNNTYELISYKYRYAVKFKISPYVVSEIRTIYITGSFRKQEQAFVALMEWVHKNIKDGK